MSVPPKTLKGKLQLNSSVDTLNDPTSPWNGLPTSWNITLSVTSQSTSYPGPRKDYMYDGRDIQIGDWIAATNGLSLQITSIISASASLLTVVASDIDNFNMYSDVSSTGDSSILSGNCLVFSDHNGLAVLLPYVSGLMSATFPTIVFSRFNATTTKSSNSGGVVALSQSTITASTVNPLSPSSDIEFQLPTGSNFYLTSLTTNMPMTVECHSTSQYNDTNPYKFTSVTGFLTDDGTFNSGGTTYYGPKNILLQNSEDQTSANSFWKITSNSDNGQATITLSILSFSSTGDTTVTINSDGSTTNTVTP